jgi:hypothetical protein
MWTPAAELAEPSTDDLQIQDNAVSLPIDQQREAHTNCSCARLGEAS